MTCTHLLVADAASARVFAAADGGKTLVEIAAYAHPESRLPGHALERDRPPRTHDRMGRHRHAIEPHTRPRTREANRFAHALADAMEHLRLAPGFESWGVVAPPRFLGQLRAKLSPELRHRLGLALARNLTQADPGELAKLLRSVQPQDAGDHAG